MVTASADPVPFGNLSRTVKVITRDEIQRLRIRSITDVLRLAASVDLRTRAPFGIQTDLSIRGANFSQVVVLLDGLRLNDSQTAHHNSDFPVSLDAFGSIETRTPRKKGLPLRLIFGNIYDVIQQFEEIMLIRFALSVRVSLLLVALCLCSVSLASESGRQGPAGPLRAHPQNPRYFTDGSGKAVYLTGSHTWPVFQDFGAGDPPKPFDYPAFLNFLVKHNHNFTRMWVWEHSTGKRRGRESSVHPLPFERTGPGDALDGRPKFDLTKLNPDYFDRLRSRVIMAGERGIYVAVMLFEGWSIENKTDGEDDPWPGHPFHPANNINGIDGDPNKDGRGTEAHTLAINGITALQEAYVRRVIQTLNDLDNVLYEISNESGPFSTPWQYHMIQFIKDQEQKLPKQHPVGMTFQWAKTDNGKNVDLFNSPADWVSPNDEGGYKDNPPVAEGNKVTLADTDHLWGVGGDGIWVWKSFLRGLNPIFMDPVERDSANLVSARQAMGHARAYAQKMNLAAMTPRNELSSTGYCLAAAGQEYLFLQPVTGPFHVFLPAGDYNLEWFDPSHNEVRTGKTLQGGGWASVAPIFPGPAVLYLKRR